MNLLKFNVTQNAGTKKEKTTVVVIPKEANGVLFKELKLNHEYPKMIYLCKNKQGKEIFADLIIEEFEGTPEEKFTLIEKSSFKLVERFFAEQEEDRDPDPTDENGFKKQLLAKYSCEADPSDYVKTYLLHTALKIMNS